MDIGWRSYINDMQEKQFSDMIRTKEEHDALLKAKRKLVDVTLEVGEKAGIVPPVQILRFERED